RELSRIAGSRVVLVQSAKRVRNQLEVPVHLQVQAFQVSRDIDLKQVKCSRNRRPKRLLVATAQVAHNLKPPCAVRARDIAKGPKRNDHFRLPATRSDLRTHGPDTIPVPV